MKHTWVTSLSVFGIIGAGSAAVLANTTVFNGVTKSDAAISISAGAPESSTSTTSTVAATDPSLATTTAAPVGPVPQGFAVGDSGTVQLTLADGIITINSALPAAGWSVQSASAPSSWVAVEFGSPAKRVLFNAFVVDGQVQVLVDSAAPDQPVAGAVNPPKATRNPSTTSAVQAATVPPPPTTEASKRTPRTTTPRTTEPHITDPGDGDSDD